MRRIAHALALVGALATLTTACASNKATGLPTGPSEEPTTAACDATIDMTDALKFVPESCTVKVGTEVTWTTAGAAPHTATSEPDAPIKFDSLQVDGGKSFSFKFETAGTIPYYCKLHASPGTRSGMVGTITVEAA
ncbi:MAG: cupredoxin domain-containing protein [Actinomycetota bacterium]